MLSFKRLAASLVLAFSIGLFTAGSASSADFVVPSQKIEVSNKKLPLNSSTELKVSSVTVKPKYFVTQSVSWLVFSVDKDGNFVEKKLRYDSNGKAFFDAGSKNAKYKVTANISNLYVVYGPLGNTNELGIRSNILTIDLVVGDGIIPPPNPDEPKFNDGQFKLALTSYRLARDKVDVQNRKANVNLAISFNTMAAKIAAGKELDKDGIKQVLKETTDANREAIKDAGLANETWDGFFIGLQDVIFNLYVEGKLRDKQSFVNAWKEISEGLKVVK